MKIGKTLVEDIRNYEVARRQCVVWRPGQHGFIVKFREEAVYLDPFLSPHLRRQVQPLSAPNDVVNAYLICGTHDHADHIDRQA